MLINKSIVLIFFAFNRNLPGEDVSIVTGWQKLKMQWSVLIKES